MIVPFDPRAMASRYNIHLEFRTVPAGGESLGWMTFGCPVLQGELIALGFVACLRQLILILLDHSG